ncbi:MAG: ABC transporter ATP-binding protein [Geminicoccaceae bacterium]
MTLLEIRDLGVRIGDVPILSNVSFSMECGSVLGLVGESGSGKSMTALSIMGLLPDRAVAGGSIRFDGSELLRLDERQRNAIRGRRIAMIFQEPMTALNPVMTVGRQIAEGMRLHRTVSEGRIAATVRAMMDRVGLPTSRFSPDLYPHQLSGGQRQRIMIAMALALEPDLLIADEPTTALDVTVQLEILKLIRDVVRERDMGLLLITHDLGVVAAMCERMMVMYAGQVVEAGGTDSVLKRLAHPYTRGLLDALPSPLRVGERLHVIPGTVSRPGERARGCAFAPRCGRVSPVCHVQEPPMWRVASGHEAACFHPAGTSGS